MNSQPNILLIMSDQHSPHVLGCNGDVVVRTPHLDNLAASGINFSNTYCNSPICVPSRMSFMTGQLPSDLEILRNEGILNSYTPTFAHALNLADYETVLCGRMHFGGHDVHHGFVKRLVGDVSGGMKAGPLFDNGIPPHTGQKAAVVRGAGAGYQTYMAIDDDVARGAVRYLQQRDQKENENPFCMVAGFLLPHNPYICPRELFEEYMDKVSVPEMSAEEEAGLHPAIKYIRKMRGEDTLTREEHRRARAAYYGLTTYLDMRIGEVLEALRQTRFAENTIVIYVSDHGDMCGEHGMWWKSTFYEGAAKVPMLWSWPGHFPANVTVDAVTSLVDISSTLIDFANAPQLPLQRGHSLRALLETGADAAWPDQAISEIYILDFMQRMIRQGRWKLNQYQGYDFPQLFDLQNDPGELHDLGNDAAQQTVKDELLLRLSQFGDIDSLAEKARISKENFIFVRDSARKSPPQITETWELPKGYNRWEIPGKIE